MPYRIGFDVGGTFTDLVLQSPSGELLIAKRLTTYPDPSEACLAGLDELVARSGVTWRDVAQAVHGWTLGSNVVIERKARGVGLLTTRCFRDLLLIEVEYLYQVYGLLIEEPALAILGQPSRDAGRARLPAGARRRPGGARLRGPAFRHAVLRRRRDGGGDAALPRADDRVGSRRGRPDGGGVRRAHRPPRPDRVRHGGHDRQARTRRARAALHDDGVRAPPRQQRPGQRPADEHSGDRPRRDRCGRRLDRPRAARRDRRGPGERLVGAGARLLRAR